MTVLKGVPYLVPASPHRVGIPREKTSMSYSRLLLLPLVLALLTHCNSNQAAPTSLSFGSMQLAVSTAAAPSEVTRVTVTVSGPDIDSRATDLVLTDGAWGGVIGRIPAGAHRSFLAQAFDSSNHLRYQGETDDVTVTPDTTGLVSLLLQLVTTSGPTVVQDAFIDSLVVSATTVAPGGTLSLTASAHSTSTFTYGWSAPAGKFSNPSSSSTQWTAPSTPGPVTLTVSVGPPFGPLVHVSRGITVYVSSSGSEQVSVGFNSPPIVWAIVNSTALPSTLDVGQPVTLLAIVDDFDNDAVSYQWSATCPSTLADANTDHVTFTPTALPTATCNNCVVSVTVDDGRGGKTTSGVALCVAKNPSSAPPSITRTYQSSATAKAGQTLTFEVEASDPAGSALSFVWAASTGTPGTAGLSPNSSRLTWTAPACVASGTSPSLAATVTNAAGLKATQGFSVTGLPTCAGSSSTVSSR